MLLNVPAGLQGEPLVEVGGWLAGVFCKSGAGAAHKCQRDALHCVYKDGNIPLLALAADHYQLPLLTYARRQWRDQLRAMPLCSTSGASHPSPPTAK